MQLVASWARRWPGECSPVPKANQPKPDASGPDHKRSDGIQSSMALAMGLGAIGCYLFPTDVRGLAEKTARPATLLTRP
jgi:hypothetical protein